VQTFAQAKARLLGTAPATTNSPADERATIG
jgi:hypothetical protein